MNALGTRFRMLAEATVRSLGVAACTAVVWLAAGLLGAATLAGAAGAAPVVLDPNSGCGPALDRVQSSIPDCQLAGIVAYGGWAAWSRLDASTHKFALVVRSPQGAIAPVAVAESASPFDVQLGPSGRGVAAVYSRCANGVAYTGCHIAELPLGVSGASERSVAIPISGSLHEPAIWRGRIAFLRRNSSGGSEDYYHPTARHPDEMFTWQVGSKRVLPVTLPSSLGSREAGWPRGLTGVITGLTLNGSQLAYVTSTGVQTSAAEFSMFTVWYQLLGQGPRLIDQTTAGQANVCVPAFLSPTIVGEWLYAYLHACDPSANAGLDRFTRYGLRARTAQRAAYRFVHSSEEAIFAVVPDGGGVDWNDGEVQRLASVAWRSIPRPEPQSFCVHSDLFC